MAEIPRTAANELTPVMVRIRISEVERVVPGLRSFSEGGPTRSTRAAARIGSLVRSKQAADGLKQPPGIGRGVRQMGRPFVIPSAARNFVCNTIRYKLKSRFLARLGMTEGYSRQFAFIRG
jgi:hypothetical protein